MRYPHPNRVRTCCLLSIGFVALAGCGVLKGNGSNPAQPPVSPASNAVATPKISTSPAQNGALVVSLADTTSGAAIYYTLDGSTPTAASTRYFAPFLIAQNVSVEAVAIASGLVNSTVASQTFAPNIAPGTLVWSDEFTNTTGSPAAPSAETWGYDTGANGWGNNELEDYCAYGSTVSPCNPADPNAYVGVDNALHIVVRQPVAGTYTSARLKTQGLFSFQYGRLEFRAQVAEAQGFWPAGWLVGTNIATINWPGCGEQDVLERVNAATTPDYNEGSVHGPGFTVTALSTPYHFPGGQTAAGWHTYGMIWKPGSVAYYVDSPTNIYATYTPANLPAGATWPFDGGQPNFILLNFAVGGNYPGSPNASTPFPSEFVIDYVRIFTN